MLQRSAHFAFAVRLGALLTLLGAGTGGCGNGSPSYATGPLPGDSTGSPIDSTPPDPDTTGSPPDTVTSPPDTVPSPPDTVTSPPDSTDSLPPAPPPTHVGLAFGPAQQPPSEWGKETDATVWAAQPESLLTWLDRARRANLRYYISFTGSAPNLVDGNGFSITRWKQRVDRFRGIDLQSYIDDGTIAGHFLLDEADDKSNWNGKIVPVELIEEMARYSKEIWPTMPTIVRAFPSYLATYPHQYQYLDAVRVQYHARFGDLEQFIRSNADRTKQLGLILMAGLNVLKGGGPESGIPSPSGDNKYYMDATQLRSWGKRFLAEPGLCGFIMWQYDSVYFSRPDIIAAMAELKQQAERLPNRACRK